MAWISQSELQRLQELERDYNSQERRHKKTVKGLSREHKDVIEDYEATVKDLEGRNKSLLADVASLESLKNDATAVKTGKLEVEEREKLAKSRETNIKEREAAVEEEETKQYKSGYEDGVADGLRKGYDLTADDRQNAAMIAALAAASHSDGATQKIAEEIVKGMTQRRALPQGKKK